MLETSDHKAPEFFSHQEVVDILEEIVRKLQPHEGKEIKRLGQKTFNEIHEAIAPLRDDHERFSTFPGSPVKQERRKRSLVEVVDLSTLRQTLKFYQRLLDVKEKAELEENRKLVSELKETIERLAELSGQAKEVFGHSWEFDLVQAGVLKRAPKSW